MKIKTTRLLTPLSQEAVLNLTSDVKEVLVPGYSKCRNRILSTADLWYIRRRQKVRVHRRYF